MAWRNPSCGGRNFEDKLRCTYFYLFIFIFLTKKEFSSAVMSCLLVEASLCLEATERPQWPRVYSLGRPRSCSRMPSLVGDSGQVLGVLGWALTRICNLPLVMHCCRQDISTVAVCGKEL